MRLLLILFGTIHVLLSQTRFLEADEIENLKKGRSFILSNKEMSFTLSFDIWQDSYILYNQSLKQSFNALDSVFFYLRDTRLLDFVFIDEREAKKESDIFLVDIINGVMKKFKRRKIKLLE
ncbi:MAG: hypothetical protein KDD94_02130 [Calditrichaeota bacterium]|nr:hypothetical protein [Calditrichota bacterium]